MPCVHIATRRRVMEGRRYLDSLNAGLDPELLHGPACMSYAVGAGRL